MRNILKAFMVGDIVNDDNTVCAAIVAIGDGTETLLTSGVPL